MSDIITGLYPTFSWNFTEDVEKTTLSGFSIRIGSDQTGWGANSFVGDKIDMDVDSSVPYFEYPYNNLVRGNTYYGQIKSKYPGLVEGTTSETAWFTFRFQVNALPTVTGVWITPTVPTAIDNISVLYDYDDSDNQDDAGSVIRWYNHNILQEEFNDLTEIENKYLTAGDSWMVRVTPFDGLEYGATVYSSAVNVIQSTLTITDIKVLPKDANIDDFLKVDYSLIDDPYIDPQNSEIAYEWYVNDVITTSTTQVVRLSLEAGDTVYAKVIVKNNGNISSQGQSDEITIADSDWHIYDVKIGGLSEPIGLTELRPVVEWKKHKSQKTEDDLPNYFRLFITKTPSDESPIFDTGYVEYNKDSHVFSTDIFERGKRYFVHLGAGDTYTFGEYITTEVITAGSSWLENADNNIGWTIEFKAKLGSSDAGSRQGVYIHDGTYFGTMWFAIENVEDAGETKKASRIIFTSGTTETYDIILPEAERSFDNFQTYRITGAGRDVKIYLNNKKVLDAPGILTTVSHLRQLQFGDISPNKSTAATWKFFRYSTTGAYDIPDTSGNEFEFYTVGTATGGSIDYMLDGAIPIPTDPEKKKDFPSSSFVVSWTPEVGSGKLLAFNENAGEAELPVATKNFSPITAIKFDKDQNKYMATAKGVVVIYGSKHDADYSFSTSGIFDITATDFDQITNLPASVIDNVLTTNGSIAIDTTYQTLGIEANPEWNDVGDFDPYHHKIPHGIFYFSQRTHGHSWFDNVDNEKGWQTEFTLNVGLIEQDETDDTDLDKQGVGVYVNDGVYQELIIFTKAKITFLYANVSVDINTGFRRVYRIVGKGKNLKLYQRYSIMAAGTEQLLIDGTGLFTTPAVRSGNSRKPRIAVDSDGNYHSVWHDDGARTTTIMYSKFSGATWSSPEIVIESAPFTLKNPDLSIDSSGNVFVVYEDLSYGQTEISASIKDTVGWNPKIRVTNFASYKALPKITVDGSDNIHVVWEDHRNGKAEIFWCYRSKEHEAWHSSGQFDKDENIVSQDINDSEQTGKGVSFKNPAICYTFPRVFVAFEADYGDGTSAIYVSFYDTINEVWASSGYVSESGAIGSSKRASSSTRKCVNPDITALGSHVVAVWEDQTEPISQIWGNALFADNLGDFTGATKITNRRYDCKNPSIGFVSSLLKAVILFESKDYVVGSTGIETAAIDSEGTVPNLDTSQIFADFYWVSGLFAGSATGYNDELIFIETNKLAYHPHLPKVTASAAFKLVYDYFYVLSSNASLKEEEHPDFWLIGDADVFVENNLVTSWIDTRDVGTVSSLLTKEFAFGDIDDNIGVQMEIRDISMYFGYDARPMSILRINTDTTPDWPDDRVYDLYVDAYKNILACTHSGLAYYNISDRSVQLIKIDPDLPEETNFITTAIEFIKNGVWFVGTSTFTAYSYDGGQNWHKISTISNARSISSDSLGSAVIGTSTGIYVVPLDFTNIAQNEKIDQNPIVIKNLTASDATTDDDVKVIKVDESDIIWAGTNSGVIRVENYTNKIICDTKNGMRSSFVTDIYLLGRGVRYIATVTGLERMRGLNFEHVDVLDLGAVSENILSLNYLPETRSLWFSSENKLYELTFRDPEHSRTPNEVVEYDTEIGMEQSRDKTTNYILGLNTLPNEGDFTINEESISVLVNDNTIEYGYSVDTNLDAIVFSAPPLDSDRISVKISNKFSTIRDFTQTSIEEQIYGHKDTSIVKLAKTAQNQLLVLSGKDNYALMAYIGLSNLPFGLLTVDREKPVACLETVEQITRSSYKFKVKSSDQISGVTDMMISNYENFTTDGTVEQPFVPLEEFVVHDIGENLNETSTAYTFTDTVVIDATTYNVGTGKLLGTMTPSGQTTPLVFAVTTAPVVVFRMDPTTEVWEAIATLDGNSSGTQAHSILTINEAMFVTTGSATGTGRVYRTINGRDFTLVGSGGNHIYCSVSTPEGFVYFGNDQGTIYEYSMSGSSSTFTSKFTGIGDKVLGLEYANNILYAATENSGKQGTGFQIDLTTNNVSSMFPHSVSSLSGIKLVNEDMFVVAGNRYEIWRAPYQAGDPLEFVKSYSTSTVSDLRLFKVPNEVLTDVLETTPAAEAPVQ